MQNLKRPTTNPQNANAKEDYDSSSKKKKKRKEKRLWLIDGIL